jgi:ArsR family transcriptional regulator, arsenate/arsenite/antimonite-responsive transcriptional repressor
VTASTATEAGLADSRRTDATAEPADAVALLQAVADPVRWTVLDALAGGELCVCQIQERLPIAPNLLSYHLRVLRDAGLVTTSRRGRWVDYALADGAVERLCAALPGGGKGRLR